MKYLYFGGYSKLRVMIIFVRNMGLLIVNKLFLFISPIIPTLYAHPTSAIVEVIFELDNSHQYTWPICSKKDDMAFLFFHQRSYFDQIVTKTM